MFKKSIQTQQDINQLLADRWSGRAYDAKRQVTQQQIISLLEAARWSPSCFGEQPWRYIVCDKYIDQSTWEIAFDCLAEGNQLWAKRAPVLILALAADNFSHDSKPNRWAEYDTGAASMSLCIQATDLGLMVHQIGGFNAKQAIESFAVPPQHTATAILTVGYQLPKDAISENIMERESQSRQREPLGSNFFIGQWGNPIV